MLHRADSFLLLRKVCAKRFVAAVAGPVLLKAYSSFGPCSKVPPVAPALRLFGVGAHATSPRILDLALDLYENIARSVLCRVHSFIQITLLTQRRLCRRPLWSMMYLLWHSYGVRVATPRSWFAPPSLKSSTVYPTGFRSHQIKLEQVHPLRGYLFVFRMAVHLASSRVRRLRVHYLRSDEEVSLLIVLGPYAASLAWLAAGHSKAQMRLE